MSAPPLQPTPPAQPVPIVGVIGPGETATSTDLALAQALGTAIAQAGWILLTGGRPSGVMQAATAGASGAGGLTIGILPGDRWTEASPHVQIPILTGMGQGRNVINVLSSRVVVACGFGAGTAAEIALAIKLQRPVILLNSPPAVFACFHPLDPTLTAVDTVAAAIATIRTHLPSNPG